MVSKVPKTRPAYPDEFRREAVQMLRAGRAPRELAVSVGVSGQTLRKWRRQDQVDRRERDDGLTSDEREELRRLRRENARLRQERDLLKRAVAFFAVELEHRWLATGGEGPAPRSPWPVGCSVSAARAITSGNAACRAIARGWTCG